jgi:hypothetical protein
MFARGQRVEDVAPCRGCAADQLNDDMHRGVLQRGPNIGADQLRRQFHIARPFAVANDDMAQQQRPPRTGSEPLLLLQKKFGHAAADDAAADQGDAKRIIHGVHPKRGPKRLIAMWLRGSASGCCCMSSAASRMVSGSWVTFPGLCWKWGCRRGY